MISSLTPHVIVLLVTVVWSPAGQPSTRTYTSPKFTFDQCETLLTSFRKSMRDNNTGEIGYVMQTFAARCDVIPSDPIVNNSIADPRVPVPSP